MPASDRRWRSLGSRLESARVRHGLSARRLAMLVRCGQSSVTRILAGSQRPSPELLGRLAQVLELDLAELFALAEYPVPTVVDLPGFLRARFGITECSDVEAVEALVSRLREVDSSAA